MTFSNGLSWSLLFLLTRIVNEFFVWRKTVEKLCSFSLQKKKENGGCIYHYEPFMFLKYTSFVCFIVKIKEDFFIGEKTSWQISKWKKNVMIYAKESRTISISASTKDKRFALEKFSPNVCKMTFILTYTYYVWTSMNLHRLRCSWLSIYFSGIWNV